MWQKKGFWQSKTCLKIASYFLQKKTLIKKIPPSGENDTFFFQNRLFTDLWWRIDRVAIREDTNGALRGIFHGK